ncbi:MAG TPA: CocE/NonD family hydrolase, partial [Acidimicrobiales bacterium]|nr:CocE/NonD family hydrolase [Acidimicrobiales bacterium]
MTSIAVERNLAISLHDGTVLAGDLYRPTDDRPHPVLLNFYPYRKDDIIGSLFDGTRRRFVERGYADLLVDMKGTGGSEGNYGETFNLQREGRDAAEVVEWAAAQDWCDGSVGVWGVSYGGFMAFASAAEKPAHLKAIVSVYATTDNRERLAPHGCPAWFGMYSWAAHMLAMDLLPPTCQDTDGRWWRTWQQRLRRMEKELPHGLEWQVHSPDDAYWSEGRIDATRIEVPTLLIAGWRDIFTDAMVEIFRALPGRRQLVVGPWLHVVPHLSEIEPWDWVGAMSDWWDQYLMPGGRDGRTGASVVYFAQGANTWHRDECWPPTGTSEKQLYLAGGCLDSETQPEAEVHRYAGDPTVGVAAGILDPFGTGLGWPEEQSVDDVRSLTFTTGPLGAPLEIAGSPSAELFVAIDGDLEAQLSVKLSAVGPDGRSRLITRGIYRCRPGAPVTLESNDKTGPPTGPVVGGPVVGGPVVGGPVV